MGTAPQNAPECMSGLRIFPPSHTEYTRWRDTSAPLAGQIQLQTALCLVGWEQLECSQQAARGPGHVPAVVELCMQVERHR